MQKSLTAKNVQESRVFPAVTALYHKTVLLARLMTKCRFITTGLHFVIVLAKSGKLKNDNSLYKIPFSLVT